MSKEYLIAGNWKMNLDTHEASILVHKLDKGIKAYRDVEVVLAPSFVHLQPLTQEIDHHKFKLAAQNAYHKDNGAFTGEVSFTMLRHLVQYVIIGHSERRLYFNESLEFIRDKVAAAIRNEISPILCVGETQQERRLGETKQVLHDQVTTALSNLTSEDIENVIIAYEPVWAISTFGGEIAKPTDVQREITYIRRQVAELYGEEAGQKIRVLYGGSVDDQTVRGYIELEGCNGALVGGASLHPHKFIGIVETAHALARETHGQ
jgi:triosephosphate isomerase (TIM)